MPITAAMTVTISTRQAFGLGRVTSPLSPTPLSHMLYIWGRNLQDQTVPPVHPDPYIDPFRGPPAVFVLITIEFQN